MFTMKKSVSLSTYFIGAYIVISLVYIFFTLWTNFKTNVMERSFNNGYAASVRQIMEEASKPECQPFTVFEGEKRIELVNIGCLQKAANGPQAQNTQKEPGIEPK